MNIVAIAGVADADYSGYPVTSVSLLKIAGLIKALRARDAREMIIAGHTRRPDLRTRDIDWGFFRHFFTILSLTRGGDDSVLRRVARFFERNGMTLKGIAEIAPDLLTPAGTLAGTFASPQRIAANRGLDLVRQLGPFDVGQAVVANGSGVLAIEGAEGTNGLIERTASPHNADSDRVLIKAAKPEQDLRFDLPTIGPETIARCISAGITTIALEAGRSLILARAETLKRASQAGITVVGLAYAHRTPAIVRQVRNLPTPLHLRNHTRILAHPQFARDAHKGLQLLALIAETGARAAIVARENILAIRQSETLSEFLNRTEQLGQWGDHRQKSKRNRVLVLTTAPEPGINLVALIQTSKIAGLAVLDSTHDPSYLDHLISDADRQTLFVLSPQ